MDLSPAVWIPLLSGVAVVAMAIGWGLRGLGTRAIRATVDGLRSELEVTASERDEAVEASRSQLETTAALRVELAAERRRLLEMERRRERHGHAPEAADRRSGEAPRRHLGDIVGLEAELASLRVVAARSRALEARVAELEAELVAARAIDLRHAPIDH